MVVVWSLSWIVSVEVFALEIMPSKHVTLIQEVGKMLIYWKVQVRARAFGEKSVLFCDKDQNLRILPQVFFDYISVIPLQRAFRAQKLPKLWLMNRQCVWREKRHNICLKNCFTAMKIHTVSGPMDTSSMDHTYHCIWREKEAQHLLNTGSQQWQSAPIHLPWT
jgi:hypothetical protein